MKKKILVYPCGTEIGLEIYKALSMSIHYEVYGGSCSYDHGRFAFKHHIDGLPFIRDTSSEDEIIAFNNAIKEYKFDFIYPAMDGVVTIFSKYKKLITPIIIAPEYETATITRSKRKTYEVLKSEIPVPEIYKSVNDVESFPVFIKPDVGQGSVGTYKIENMTQLVEIKKEDESQLILEYLPGKEYTIDCFTNEKGDLVYCKGRERRRIRNGISVNAFLVDNVEFEKLAQKINRVIKQKGGWFFQVKEAADGSLKLLEVASRIAGASAIQRCIGVNLPLLTVNIFNNIPVDDVVVNDYNIELDRALKNCYKVDLKYQYVYVDYDDTLVLEERVNTQLISFLFQCINQGKIIILLTKHDGSIEKDLVKHRVAAIFDKIVHLKKTEEKADYIKNTNSIFIDDSYGERKKVHDKCGIAVFDTVMIECLVED